MRSRVIFVGQSLTILDWLLTRPDIEVCAVFVPSMQRDVLDEWFTRCAQRGVTFISQATPQDVVEGMPPAIDLGICAHFDPLPKALLTATRLGFINIHPAPLPHYSGRYPLIQLTLDAAREGGVSVHWMSERVDQGDLIAVERFAVAPLDGPVELEVKAEHLARRVLSDYWEAIIDGYAPRIMQSRRALTKSSRMIPCPTEAQSGVQLWRMIRAYGPYGGLGLLHEPTSTVIRLVDARLCQVDTHKLTSMMTHSSKDIDHVPTFKIVEVTDHHSLLMLSPSLPLSTSDDHSAHTLSISSERNGPLWALNVAKSKIVFEERLIESTLTRSTLTRSTLTHHPTFKLDKILHAGDQLKSLPVDLRLRLP